MHTGGKEVMAGFATRRPDGATKVELLGDHDDGPPFTLTLQRRLPVSRFISRRYSVFVSSVLAVFIALTLS